MRLAVIMGVLVFLAITAVAQPVIMPVPNGLVADTVFFSVGNRKVSTNAFNIGTKVQLNFDGVHGFAVKDGRSYPGCSMHVLNEENESILAYEDLFAEYVEGVSSEEVRYLNVSLTVGSPLVENQSYQWVVRIWDKITKADMQTNATVVVPFIRDLLGIKRSFQGLSCEHSVITAEGPLKNNKVHFGQKLAFVLSGVKGYDLNDRNKVNLGASVVVRNKHDMKVVEMTDMFKDNQDYDLDAAGSLRLYLTVGDPMMKGQQYAWTVRVWDKNSGKAMEAVVNIVIE